MKTIITSECIKCGICIDVCPFNAIEEVGSKFFITEICINCGKCQKVCPISAIKVTDKNNNDD